LELLKKTIAIDMDSVLADTMLVWIQEYNRLKNANLTKSDIYSWDLSGSLNITIDQVSNIFTSIWRDRWREIPPTEPNIGQVIKNLSRWGFRISILTKRFRSSVPNVAKWLDFHDVHCDDLLFIYDDKPKAHYPFDILVDDAPVNLIDIFQPKFGILFNQPWNKDFAYPRRIDFLSQIETVIDMEGRCI
jgi:5'(3')-deoxyribonucleotidase